MIFALLDHPAPIVDDATRRQFLAALATAGLLTSCGAEPSPPLDTGGAGFPRTIDHQEGATTVPAQPVRIAAVDGRNDLGRPARARRRTGGGGDPLGYLDDPDAYQQRLYGDRLAGTTILEDGYDLEAVAAAAPDLIVGQNIEDAYPTMNRVAPTISITFEDWRATTRMIGLAVGRETEAEDYIGRFDAEVAELARPAGRRPSAAVVGGGSEPGTFQVRNESNAGRLLQDLGFGTALGPPDEFAEYSLERLGELDAADLLFVIRFTEADDSSDELLASPLFPRLRAVQEGNLHRVGPGGDADTWYFATALTAPACLVDLRACGVLEAP